MGGHGRQTARLHWQARGGQPVQIAHRTIDNRAIGTQLARPGREHVAQDRARHRPCGAQDQNLGACHLVDHGKVGGGAGFAQFRAAGQEFDQADRACHRRGGGHGRQAKGHAFGQVIALEDVAGDGGGDARQAVSDVGLGMGHTMMSPPLGLKVAPT